MQPLEKKQEGRKGLPPAVRALLESKWKEQFAGPTGCADYEALRAAIKATPEQQSFGPPQRSVKSPVLTRLLSRPE